MTTGTTARAAATHWLKDMPCSPLNGKPGRKKVAIVAASALGEERPPLEDNTWDVWSCNSLWRQCLDTTGRLRADAWFEMHPLAVQTAQERTDMHDCPLPLYVLGEPLETHWRRYPIDEIVHKFGGRDFFSCTFCYQLALAIILGYTTIGLWGVELWQGSARERTIELLGVTYWLGVAQGRGVKVVLPEYSRLLWHPLRYGYDYDAEAALVDGQLEDLVSRWLEEQR